MSTRNQYSTLTCAELLLAFASIKEPTDLEVALAERLELTLQQLEDYEPHVKTRYVGE